MALLCEYYKESSLGYQWITVNNIDMTHEGKSFAVFILIPLA